MPDPEAKLVHFGANCIFCQREVSLALLTRAYERLAAKGYPVEAVELKTTDSGTAYFKLVDYTKPRGFDMEREMHEAVSRTHCVSA